MALNKLTHPLRIFEATVQQLLNLTLHCERICVDKEGSILLCEKSPQGCGGFVQGVR